MRDRVPADDLDAVVDTLLATLEVVLLADRTPAEREHIVRFGLRKLVA